MIKAHVNFFKKLRDWDGFGFNYVETCQTADFSTNPQDYGGFSTLPEEKRREIVEAVFGEDGLKPGILKMFFGPLHQKKENMNGSEYYEINMGNYNHTEATTWTRYFAREGLKKTRSRGGNLKVVTTMYSPPGWMTKQGFIRGRDLDPQYRIECAKYMVSWIKFLREAEGLPVKYISLHNEGEDYVRWHEDGSTSGLEHGHDYNMYWPPEQVVDFIKLLRCMLDVHSLYDVGVTPGETTNWYRFSEWGYADAIADDAQALISLGLITSHGFIRYTGKRWFSEARSLGTDILREGKPALHSWVTSIDWGDMDVHFLNDYKNSIYTAKVNGLIPWAGIQCPSLWAKGDPNPGTAFRVDGKGGYTIEPGYFYYKQVSRAGQPGTGVCRVSSNDTEVVLMAFSDNGTGNGDAFVVLNVSDEEKKVDITVNGSSGSYTAYRTSEGESYASLGEYKPEDGIIRYVCPKGSATTFFSKKQR